MSDDILMKYKFVTEFGSPAYRSELDLRTALFVLERNEIKKLVDEAEGNPHRFVDRLTQAIENKITHYIRHDQGHEMDAEMNDEVYEAIKVLFEPEAQ